MALMIPNYKSEEFVLMVQTDEDDLAVCREDIFALHESSATILSVGANFELGTHAEKFHNELRTGDIISISSAGFIYKLYDSCDSDATVFITGQCNSNCIMCPCSDYERQYNTGYTDDLLRKYIELLPPDLSHIVVTGGEPTLKTNQFFMAMELLADKFPTAGVLLLTNGRSFASKSMVEKLVAHCPPFLEIAIPLHGHNAGLHDSIARATDSFKHTLMGIHNLSAKGIPIELRVVVSKLNVKYLSDIAQFIKATLPKVRIVNFIGLETLGNCAKNFEQVYMDYAETFKFIKPALRVLVDAGIDTSLYNYPLCTVERGFWSLCRQSITPHKIRYASACDECDAKTFCGGYFGSTLGVAKPKVNPIHL